MTKKVLTITSIVIFALAAFGVATSTVSLIPLGLAVFASSFLVE